MRKLLDFLVRKRHWFLFIVLEIISFTLIFQNSAYQRNVILSSANVFTGNIESMAGSVRSYLNLYQENKILSERNGALELELLKLQDQVEAMLADSVHFAGYMPDSINRFSFEFIPAEVISNSAVQLNNYITLNKGTDDGITSDMGVVSEQGVVGIVSASNKHFSVVIPLINPKFRLSCKLLKNNYFGSLNWNGRDARYSYLYELPNHAAFSAGDTIVTSGFSAIFPAGIMVGKIVTPKRGNEENYTSLKIELATNFWTLKNVRVIKNYRRPEQISVEQEAKKND